VEHFVQVAALAVVYALIARLGLRVDAVSGFATLLWPPSGIALAALLVGGFRLWPGIAIGAFAANLWVGAPLSAALGIAAGNTLEGLLGAWALRRMGFDNSLERLRDVLPLVVGGALLSTLISPTIGVFSLYKSGVLSLTSNAVVPTWRTWWFGDMAGELIVAPLLLTWSARPRVTFEPRRIVEASCLALLVVAVWLFVFCGPASTQFKSLRQVFLIFPLLIWAALRFEQRGVAATTFLASAIAVVGTARDLGPFVHDSPHASLMHLHAFLAAAAVTALVLGAAVAEHRAAHAAVVSGHRLLQAIVEQIAEAVFVKDRAGRYQLVNSTAADLLGKEAGAILEDDDTAVFPSEDARAVMAADREVLETGKTRTREEVLTIHGEPRTFLTSKAPDRDEEGRVVGLIGISRDVTEERRMMEELRGADRHKDEFLGVLSHELRNPLMAIRSGLYVLQLGSGLDERGRKAAGVIERQVSKLARLVDDLLDVTRIARGKVRLQRSSLDLARLTQLAVDDHRRVLDASEIEMVLEIPSESLWVNGDAARLEQVIGNLLDNATKFTPRRGRVTVSLAREGGRAVLEVADTGVGIDTETLARLFVPFAQEDRSLSRSRGGLGLGLALAKGLVELHHGEIHAFSEGPGHGARFTVSLPLASPAAGATPQDPEEAAREHGTAARKILVVEDNHDTADSLREVLEIAGHRVAVAYGGREGVEAAKEFRPDIVLCDIGLPGLDGYAVARELRQDATLSTAVLVALTGYAGPEDRRRAREAGFDRHLAKPVELATLGRLVAEALG
jgi:PAS domain S-box-containing protein